MLNYRPNDISGTAEAGIIKFYTKADYIIFELMDDKPPLKRHGQDHMTHL